MPENAHFPARFVGGLDLAAVPPWERRRRVLQQFDSLHERETVRLSGGREMETIHHLLAVERSGLFRWTWAEEGPERWTAYVERLPTGSLFTQGRFVT